MSDQQDPFEQLLDLVVYAPLGLLLSARDLVPTLAEKGRRHLGPQATAARMVGEIAVTQGQRGVEHLVQKGRRQAGHLVGGLFPGATRPAPGGPPPTGDPGNGSAAPAPPAPRTRDRRPAPSAAPGPTGAATTAGAQAAPAPDVSELAIPGYDTLSASQVVQRLEGLTPDQLNAVRAYEQAGRARKTVLSRIAQLTGR